MISTILKWLLVAMVLLAAFVWVLGGGFGKISSLAHSFSFGNPLSILTASSSLTHFTLPGALPTPRGIDVSKLLQGSTVVQSSSDTTDNESLVDAASDFGNPSPYRGSLTLSLDGASAPTSMAQYVIIRNVGAPSATLAGWSLQSMRSGQRAFFPRGASAFIQGTINVENDITLFPGMTAIVSSGISPVGISFQTNACSAYLATQQYAPALSGQCPSPDTVIAQAYVYGASCAAYVQSLPVCTTQVTAPAQLGSACAMLIEDEFSYNGCVREHQHDAGFAGSQWRIFLGATRTLWASDHDKIRLLDAQGRVVDVASY